MRYCISYGGRGGVKTIITSFQPDHRMILTLLPPNQPDIITPVIEAAIKKELENTTVPPQGRLFTKSRIQGGTH
jgi:hypothetical protein